MKRVVFSVWESMEQLEGWVNSLEYRKVRAIGKKSRNIAPSPSPALPNKRSVHQPSIIV